MVTTLNRADGRLKVTGGAQYAAEFKLQNTVHGLLVGSSIASGNIRGIDSSSARQLPGVLLVLTHENRGPGDRTVLASALRVPQERIRVICPFTGGMFGSKAATGANVLLAAVAARMLNRSVKIVLTRR